MRERTKSENIIKKCIIIIGGLAVLISGIFLNMRQQKRIEICTGSTTGIITGERGFQYKKGSSHQRKFRPQAEYTVDSISYTTEGSPVPFHSEKGTEVTVMYNPLNPAEAYLPDYNSHSYGAVCVLGVLMLILGTVSAVREIKK